MYWRGAGPGGVGVGDYPTTGGSTHHISHQIIITISIAISIVGSSVVGAIYVVAAIGVNNSIICKIARSSGSSCCCCGSCSKE